MSKPRYTGNDHVVDTAEGHILAPFEVLDRLNAAATLATRLAAVEAERDALREGLADIARHLAPPFEGEGSHLAWERATALLGKENEDGQD